MENVNPLEELKRLDEQITLATELAALKPIYFRLNEIVQAFPGDFDVQFTGNDVKQRLMARGTLLKQQETSVYPPPPAVPAAQPPPKSMPDTVAPAPAAPPDFPVTPVTTPLPPPFSSAGSTSAGPPPPARTPTRPYQPPPPPRYPVPPPMPDVPSAPPRGPRSAHLWSHPAVIFSVAALLVVVALVYGLMRQSRKRSVITAPSSVAAVPVDIATVPPGAAVRVTPQQTAAGGSNESSCTSNCTLTLAPGTYQVSATLDGFEPAAGAVTVTVSQPAAVSLTLQAQAQSVRLLTDLPQGQVVVDNQPPAELQEGQLVLDKVAPGKHTVKVTGPNASASFAFEAADARLPVVTAPVNARNMVAVLVASFGKQAHLVTNAGPWKLAVNSQAQSDAGPAGTDLTAFQPGVNEIVVGEGREQRNMSETFGAAPMLTAFLKTDVNAGTLIVSTGQDDVRVFLNDKEYRRRTQRGQLRVQTLGKVTVRVAKSGFLDPPSQTVEVKKGAEARLQFDLKLQPQFGSLEIHGAMAGTEVVFDQKNAGSVGPDGSFNLGSIQPGDHTIELRRDQYQPKRLPRTFRAGQAVTLAGGDVVLVAARANVRLTRNPASATITYRRNEEAETHEARGNQIELPPGNYAFAASSPGFTEATTRIQLAAGESRELDFSLARERPVPPPPPVAKGMSDFEDAQSWKKEGDSWIHTGGGFVAYKLRPKGVFTFTVELVKGGGVFRGGKVSWCLQYIDPKNYLLYEMDRKNFWAGVIENGKRLERIKEPHNLGTQKGFTIQIEVTPEHLIQRLRVGSEWKVIETFVEPGRDFTQGKFGFLIPGNDQIAISDFKFLPQ